MGGGRGGVGGEVVGGRVGGWVDGRRRGMVTLTRGCARFWRNARRRRMLGTGADSAKRFETYPFGRAPQCTNAWLTTVASLSGRVEEAVLCRGTVVGLVAVLCHRHTTVLTSLVSSIQRAWARCVKPRSSFGVGLPTQRDAPVWARSPHASAKTQRLYALSIRAQQKHSRNAGQS